MTISGTPSTPTADLGASCTEGHEWTLRSVAFADGDGLREMECPVCGAVDFR